MTAGKREQPLWLDMSFGEALTRFGQTEPAELPDNSKLGKKAGGHHPLAAEVNDTGASGRNRKRKPRPPLPTG